MFRQYGSVWWSDHVWNCLDIEIPFVWLPSSSSSFCSSSSSALTCKPQSLENRRQCTTWNDPGTASGLQLLHRDRPKSSSSSPLQHRRLHSMGLLALRTVDSGSEEEHQSQGNEGGAALLPSSDHGPDWQKGPVQRREQPDDQVQGQLRKQSEAALKAYESP